MGKKSTRFFIMGSMLSSHFARLESAYIFPVIEKKLAALQKEHPNQKILNLGVGDISLPLSQSIAKAVCEATIEMTKTPRGYGPSDGYPFLKETICTHEYASFGISPEEIFISDGAGSDITSIQEIFSEQATVLVTDPTYPAYRDANVIAGKRVLSVPLKEEEGFIPRPPRDRADLVYLCTPCNPTGVAMNREALSEWISWAKKNKSLLIIDNVYQAFATSEDLPSSIYELEGAKEVAIEIRSFSKWAGFTGLRCGYMVVPKTLHIPRVHELWAKRVDIKCNGVPYPIQKGAQAAFGKEAKEELASHLAKYQASAKILRNALSELEQTYFGGIDAPYIFWKTPKGATSWEFFDTLLERARLLCIPGPGFGSVGEGFVRLSCFLTPELATESAHALHHHFATV